MVIWPWTELKSSPLYLFPANISWLTVKLRISSITSIWMLSRLRILPFSFNWLSLSPTALKLHSSRIWQQPSLATRLFMIKTYQLAKFLIRCPSPLSLMSGTTQLRDLLWRFLSLSNTKFLWEPMWNSFSTSLGWTQSTMTSSQLQILSSRML